MSPDRREGVFGALGWAGDRAKARALPHYAGPVTERTNGLVPEQSGGTKPIESLRDAFKLRHVSHSHIMEIVDGKKAPTFDKVMQLLVAYHADVHDFLRETGYLPKNVDPAATGKMRKIPVVSWVVAGKWEETGESFHQEDAVDWIETDVKGEHNFGLKIKGDSMEPELSSPEAMGLVSQGEKLHHIRSLRSLRSLRRAKSSSSTPLRRRRTAITLS